MSGLDWMLTERPRPEPEIRPITIREAEPAELILLIGNVGTGKSRTARRLALEGALVVCGDDLVTMGGAGNYSAWDPKRHRILKAGEDAIVRAALNAGQTIVVDRTLMTRDHRLHFINMARCRRCAVIGYDFGPGTPETLARRQAEPRGLPPERWAAIHDKLQRSYQRPEKDEGFEAIYRVAP